ncbi:hypothetical protein MHTCC0001_07610 [Flavobacteriaceae bacterium MHTCC 0001]
MKCYLVFFFFIGFISIGLAQKSDFAHIDFRKADSIAHSYNRVSLKNMPLLVHQLTDGLNTQVEQFRAIHTWVCLNIESDHYFSEKTLRKRRELYNNKGAFNRWNVVAQAKVFKRLLKHKKTICSGYAYLVKTLANIANIDCEIVDGYARSVRTNLHEAEFPNHSWNVVKLSGKWYLIDTTQASGFYDLDEHKFVKNYNDGYFLAPPELFAKNHYPLDENWLLLDNPISLKAFVNAPVIYGEAYKYGIIPQMPITLVTQASVGQEVKFQLKIFDKNIIDAIQLVELRSNGYRALKPIQTSFNDSFFNLKYRFKKKGNYDLHIKIKEDLVASYTVKVV